MGNAIQKVTVPRATHSGRLKFANVECHVLDNGTRLVTQRGVVAALSGGRESGNLAPYIDRIPNKPGGFDAGAIDFHLKTGQQVGHGIPADKFVQIVTLYANALLAGQLHRTQEDIGRRCAAMLFALAGVGITAMIDEATGYRVATPKNELERKLQLFMLEAPDPTRDTRVPREFRRELFKLYRKPFHPVANPPFFGQFYRRALHDVVDAEVARVIKERNPEPCKGSQHYLHYTGPALSIFDAVVRTVITLMRQSDSVGEFWERHRREFYGAPWQMRLGAGAE